jgi:hypothetical protein
MRNFDELSFYPQTFAPAERKPFLDISRQEDDAIARLDRQRNQQQLAAFLQNIVYGRTPGCFGQIRKRRKL